MGKEPADLSNPSHPVTPERPCYRCRGDATADPCGPCPLYRAYLERVGRPDDPDHRTVYDDWARRGGWLLLWALHGLARRRAARIRAIGLMVAYPSVAPAIVAHHLEVR